MDKETQEIEALVQESIRHPDMTSVILGCLMITAFFVIIIYCVRILIFLSQSPIAIAKKEILNQRKKK